LSQQQQQQQQHHFNPDGDYNATVAINHPDYWCIASPVYGALFILTEGLSSGKRFELAAFAACSACCALERPFSYSGRGLSP